MTNTFEITKKITDIVEDEQKRNDSLLIYIKEISKWNDGKEFKPELAELMFTIDSAEFMTAHKQDRVDITIEVKKMLNKA